MNFKDYIKQEYYDEYINERENLEDRLIEAKYNLLFLRMMYERSEVYRKSNATSREEIRIVLTRCP